MSRLLSSLTPALFSYSRVSIHITSPLFFPTFSLVPSLPLSLSLFLSFSLHASLLPLLNSLSFSLSDLSLQLSPDSATATAKPTSSFYEALNTSFNQLRNFNFTQLSARMSDEVVKTPQIVGRGDKATRPPPSRSSSQPSLSPSPTQASPASLGDIPEGSVSSWQLSVSRVDVSLVISIKLPEWPHCMLTPNLEAIFLFEI